MHCNNCGERLPETAKFCQSCGTAVAAATDLPDSAAREGETNVKKRGFFGKILDALRGSAGGSFNRCPHCGATLPEEMQELIHTAKTSPININLTNIGCASCGKSFDFANGKLS